MFIPICSDAYLSSNLLLKPRTSILGRRPSNPISRAYLEDRAVYIKEGVHNGLYGPTAFMLSNFIIGLPFLLLIDITYSIISYWLCGFQPTAKAFVTWLMWLFLDLLAAESLVVLVTSILPNGGKPAFCEAIQLKFADDRESSCASCCCV